MTYDGESIRVVIKKDKIYDRTQNSRVYNGMPKFPSTVRQQVKGLLNYSGKKYKVQIIWDDNKLDPDSGFALFQKVEFIIRIKELKERTKKLEKLTVTKKTEKIIDYREEKHEEVILIINECRKLLKFGSSPYRHAKERIAKLKLKPDSIWTRSLDGSEKIFYLWEVSLSTKNNDLKKISYYLGSEKPLTQIYYVVLEDKKEKEKFLSDVKAMNYPVHMTKNLLTITIKELYQFYEKLSLIENLPGIFGLGFNIHIYNIFMKKYNGEEQN